MATKIVFVPRMPAAIWDIAHALTPPGYELTAAEPGTAELYDALADAEFFMGFARENLGSEFYRAAPKLALVQLVSAGYDRIDIEAARKARVPVANNGGANAAAVAEHTLMLILAVLKKLVWQHKNVVAGRWRVGDFGATRLHELDGMTVGIVGLGNIGKKVVRRLRGFDVSVIYSDPIRLSGDQEDALGVRFALLSELLREANVVTLHVPLTDTTRKLIGARELGMMKPSAILINTSRGPVLDEEALYQALSAGRIAGAGLDVLVDEPPPANHPLFGLETVTFTPHTAGPTWETWAKLFRNAFDNIERVRRGDRPLWVIPELRDLFA